MQIMTILNDLQQVMPFGLGERFEAEVVQNQQIEPGEMAHDFAIAAVPACDPQFIEQPGCAFISHAHALSTGRLAECASEPTFSSARRPGDVQVLMRANPVAVDERYDLRPLQSAPGLVVDLFHASLLFETR